VTAADARVKTAETLLQQAQDLERDGAASKLDIARAEQQLESDRGARINAQKDHDVLVTSLLEVIGIEPGPDPVVLEAPALTEATPAAETALSTALSQRAEVRVAEAQARVATQERAAAARERLPKLEAFGDYGVLGQGPDHSVSTYSAGAQVSFPLWTGRRIESRIAEATARIGLAEQELRRAKLQIAREVRQAQIELDAARQATSAAEKAATAARTSLELARLRFVAGLATNIDTVVAQGTLAEAEDGEIRARYEQQLARARLARAQGNVYGFLQ
jgi:outer membrane protein